MKSDDMRGRVESWFGGQRVSQEFVAFAKTGWGEAVRRSSVGKLALICFLIPISVSAFAQVGNSSLSGVVSDSSGAAIPRAQVTLHRADEFFVRSTTAGSDGAYVIPTLPPGRYQLTVSASGFGTEETQPFELSSGQVGSLNVTLKVAKQTAQIEVESATPLLQTTSASLGTVLSQREMTSIPLLGRSFLNALSLAPGVVPVPPAGSTTNHSPVNQSTIPSVFGQRQKDNNFLIDGVENRDANLLGVAIYPPPDAILEMTIDSGVGSSAYGHASGATVDIVTKSGTTAWHGDAWEYWRNNILDAKSYFQQSVGQYHWNQFGGDAGGPLVIPWLLSKDRKWYVFGYYEGVRILSPSDYTAFVPTAAQLSGNFAGFTPIYDPFSTTGTAGSYSRQQFPNNQIPASMLNATALKVASLYPTPNLAPGVIPGSNYINNAGSGITGNQWNLRVDHQFGDRDSFFARYTAASNPSYSVSLPEVPASTTDQLRNAEASDTHVFSKSMVATLRYGLTGVNYFTGNTFPAGLAAASGFGSVFPTFLGSEIIPPIGINGYTGIPLNNVTVGPVYQHSGIVDAQKIIGEHTIEFGGSVVDTNEVQAQLTSTNIEFQTTQTANFNATTGDGMASFLLGVPDSAGRQIGGTVANLTTDAFGVYAQDTWRHGPLTLNGGLRYDYNAVPVNSYGLGGFDYGTGTYIFDMKNPITGAPANIRRGGRPPDRTNIAPRFGVAYQLSPRTVVRASAGVFFDSFGSNYIQASESALGNWPFSFPQSVSGLNASTVTAQLPNPFPGNPVGSPTPSAPCTQCLNVDKDSSRTPYVGEWTLSLQRQIGSNLTLEAAYFGSKGTKLTAQIVDNTATTAGPAPYSDRQLYPQYPPYVLNGYNEFASWYNGAALRLQRRYSNGLSFLFSYTFSKNIDFVDNLSSGNVFGQVTSNPTRFNADLDRGLAGFDIRHVLVLSNVWNVPLRTQHRLVNAVVAGWALSDIFSFHSGLPFSVFLGSDNENIGTIGGRYTEYPDIVGNPSIAHRTPFEWFNTAAFAAPPVGTVGNMRRNPPNLKTDNLIDDDLAAGKTWPIYEQLSFELRGEFFNLFNHANFGSPGQVLGTSQFGTVSSTLNTGRTVQLVAKIHF